MPTLYIQAFIHVVIFLSFLSCSGFAGTIAGENAFTFGYGFGMLNRSAPGRIENGLQYDFVQLSYLYEKPFAQRLILGLEPFININNRPDSGIDTGCTAYFKSYIGREANTGFYFTVGTGGAYTSLKFSGQGTHMLFILHGGIGYRHGRIFIENRFNHYSNGGMANPNRSVNANIIRVGYYF